MDFNKSNSYDTSFVKENMMGPNAMKIVEELALSLNLQEGMRVLDLGCGRGLTSIFLAKEYGVTVFATDLWISATDNYARFRNMGLEDNIVPIHAEAHNLPFAEQYFDLLLSVDAYNYFGTEEDYLAKHYAPLVKKGGTIAIAVPGIKREFIDGVPRELQPFWTDGMNTLHSVQWWCDLWERSGLVDIVEAKEMECLREAWRDWLSCDNPHAREDIPMMEAEAGNYFNIVSLIARSI